jgi:hypothetical protein
MSARTRRYVGSLLIQLALAPFLAHDWDAFVFTHSVRDFLSGWTPYAVVENDPAYIHLGSTWPPLNTWYAYPPFALLLMTPTLAAAFAAGAAPWLVRIALKLPFIAGTLALSWIGAELLRSWRRTPDVSTSWERMILFNPLLLFVSAAWGMFDAWLVAFLLLSVLLIDRGRIRLAGVAFGASALVKLFPLFAAPALLLYVARRAPRRGRDAASFAIAAAGTFAAVSLPFFVPHPRGFLLQVLGMHLQRPPQGLSLPAVIGEAARFAAAEGWIHGEPSLRALAVLPFGVTLGVTAAITVTAARAHTSAALVRALLGLFLGVLYTSKVLNEQYFVIPVGLYALVACASDARWARFGYHACTAGALVASLLLGWHVLTFWPSDVAAWLFREQPYVLVGRLAAASGLGSEAFAFAPTFVSFCVLVPALVIGVGRIVRECRAGARTLAVLVARRLGRSRPPVRAIVAALLLGPPAIQAAALAAERPRATPPLDSAERHVGTFYYLWWANPSHSSATRGGNWLAGVSETPADGYFTVSSAKLRDDFRLARSNGIDLIVASFHGYDLPVVPAALQAAYDQNMAIAPLIELGEVFARPEYRSADEGFALRDDTAAAIVEMASKALSLFAKAPAAYRPGGKLAVFLDDAYFSGADWRPTSTRQLLERALAIAEDDARRDGSTPPSRDDLEQEAPASLDAILGEGSHGYLWRRAYAELTQEFWQRVRRELEGRFGPVFLFGGESWNPGAPFHRGAQTAIEGLRVFDATFVPSPSVVWAAHRGDPFERNWQRWVVRSVMQAQYARGAGRPVVATVLPAYDDRVARKAVGFEIPVDTRNSTYDLTWSLASGLRPDLVLIASYNQFFEGTALEPTVEHGDAFLLRTRDWSARMRIPTRPKKRGLVLTSESGAHYGTGRADPIADERCDRDLQLLAERDLPDYAFDAIDVEALDPKDLPRYDLVLVEPRPDAPPSTVAAIAPRLQDWAKAGGRLFVSGASARSGWQKVVLARGGADIQGAYGVTAADGRLLALPAASHPQIEEVDADVDVVLRFADGDSPGSPAAWSRRTGAGVVAGSAMNVTGHEAYPSADATAVFCECVRLLLSPGDRCANTRPDVVQ